MSIPKEIKEVLTAEERLLKQLLLEIANRDPQADEADKGKQMTYFNKSLDLLKKLREIRRDITLEVNKKDVHAIETSPEAAANLSLLDEARKGIAQLN